MVRNLGAILALFTLTGYKMVRNLGKKRTFWAKCVLSTFDIKNYKKQNFCQNCEYLNFEVTPCRFKVLGQKNSLSAQLIFR